MNKSLTAIVMVAFAATYFTEGHEAILSQRMMTEQPHSEPTTPTEWPILRTAEIISTLSGSHASISFPTVPTFRK